MKATNNPYIGTTGKERYELFRSYILAALDRGALPNGALGRAIGLTTSAISTAIIKTTGNSKLRQALLDLQEENLIRTYKEGKRLMWELVPPEKVPTKVETKTFRSADELFQQFKDAVQKEADKKAEEYYKYLIDGIQKKNERLVEKIVKLESQLSFRQARKNEHAAEDPIWGMCAKCARTKYPRMDFSLLSRLKVKEDSCPVCFKYDGIIPLSDVEYAAGLSPIN